MKIILVTTMVDAPEALRIKEEFESKGHEFETYDVSSFSFSVVNNELAVPGLTDKNPDIVVIRGILKHLKPMASLIKRLRTQGIKVFDNNFLEHKYSISKVTDFIKLSMAGIPLPDSYYVMHWEDYATVGEKVGYPFIIKSVRSGQGKGVYMVDSKEELSVFMREMQEKEKKAKNFMIQKFFDYEVDLRVLVIGEKMFTMRRIPREGDFRANFSLGGTVEKYDLEGGDRKLALDAMKAIGMSIGGVDILIGKDGGRCILEVNHTAGMKGMEAATGKNIVKVYVEHVLANAN